MAPEQLTGGAVTARTDLYALGLILYEVFTGRKPFEAKTVGERLRLMEESRPESVTGIAGTDPAVERAILRCLEKEPQQRPSSALAVAAALPGGDPLAAALAAGETPSPELVAASGTEGTIHPAIGWACLFAMLAGMVFQSLPAATGHLLRVAPNQWPPEVLAKRAQEILTSAGHTQPPADASWTYDFDEGHLADSLRLQGYTPEHVETFRKGHPSALLYVYRQSPIPLHARFPVFQVTRNDPPLNFTGMATVVLDSQARLRSLEVVAPQRDDSSTNASGADWSRLFEAAGLDQKQFTAAVPQWTPALFCDERLAWEGVYPERPELKIRVEGGSYRGNPVWFEVVFPWTRPARMQARVAPAAERRGFVIFVILFFAVPLVFGLVIAQRNLRLGRGDRVGATRLSCFVFVTWLASGLFGANHMMGGAELVLLFGHAAFSLLLAALTWPMYVALEPYARRRWPRMLVSWSRLLTGKWLDPLVGRDVLLGAAAWGVFHVVWNTSILVAPLVGMQALGVQSWGLPTEWGTGRQVPFSVFASLSTAAPYGLAYLFALLLIRAVVRKQWLAVALLGCLHATMFGLQPTAIGVILGVSIAATALYLLLRHGLLPLMALNLFGNSSMAWPLEFSTWYAQAGLVHAAVLLAFAAFGFYTATRGRRLFQTSLLED